MLFPWEEVILKGNRSIVKDAFSPFDIPSDIRHNTRMNRHYKADIKSATPHAMWKSYRVFADKMCLHGRVEGFGGFVTT